MRRRLSRRHLADPSERAFMDAAWASFLDWAIRQPQIVDEFRRATSRPDFMRQRSPIDRLIDQACGVPPAGDNDDVAAFVRWATHEYWGIDDAPIAYQIAEEIKQ